jgi:hypothetical protein
MEMLAKKTFGGKKWKCLPKKLSAARNGNACQKTLSAARNGNARQKNTFGGHVSKSMLPSSLSDYG